MNGISDQTSFLEVLHPESKVLVIAFAGIQVKKHVPSFHYVNALKERPVNRLHVRDVRQAFYQRGIPETGNNAGSVGEYLRSYVKQRGVRRIICLGGSAGGYAALLYGWFIGADEVHAFSPLTKLPSRTVLQSLPLLYSGQAALFKAIWPLHVDRSIDRTYFDLAPLLAQHNGQTHYQIYFGSGHDRDVRSAKRLTGFPGTELHEYDTANHHIVTDLRDSGALAEILDRAIANPDS